MENLQTRKEWHNIFKILKGETLPPRIFFPEGLSFRIEKEMKNFSGKQKLKELINVEPTQREVFKGLLSVEWKGPHNVRIYRKGKITVIKTNT